MGCFFCFKGSFLKKGAAVKVNSSMSDVQHIAPNLTELVGPAVAAKMIEFAGGLRSLCSVPTGKLRHLGRKEAVDEAESVRMLHAGCIVDAPIVQTSFQSSLENKKKLVQVLACKCHLAAAVDLAGSSPSGSYGRELLDSITKEIEEKEAPKKVADRNRALPVPKTYEELKPKRAGARVQKERLKSEPSTLEVISNIRRFGEDDESFAARVLTRREVIAEMSRHSTPAEAPSAGKKRPREEATQQASGMVGDYSDLADLVL